MVYKSFIFVIYSNVPKKIEHLLKINNKKYYFNFYKVLNRCRLAKLKYKVF